MNQLVSRLDQALNKENKSLFIFDIDSTIFNVSPRNQAIFDLFTSLHKKSLPKESTSKRLKPTDWGLDPYTNLIQDPQLKQKIKNFWTLHFFSGTFLYSDQPYPGILQLISIAKGKNAEIMFLTGRDHQRMRAGTLKQLRHWKILDRDSQLITKPHKSIHDDNYKKNELEKILQLHPNKPIFFFDNEPTVFKNCLFPENNKYTPVFIKSTHSGRNKQKKSWISLSAFEYNLVNIRFK